MKTFFVVLLLVIAVSSSPSKTSLSSTVQEQLLELQKHIRSTQNENKAHSVNINQYMDKLMPLLDIWIVKNGLDPMQAPDLGKGFSVKLGLITFHGEFYLTQGWVQGLSTVERAGDATISYEARFLNLRLPLVLDSILVNYDYLAKIMNLGPKGGVEGKIKNLHILVDVNIDMKNVEIILQGFKITNAGHITINFSGNPLVDWLTNILDGLATTLLHDVVVGIVQNKVREVLVQSIDEINQGLHQNATYLH